jgi:hypothetical protein
MPPRRIDDAPEAVRVDGWRFPAAGPSFFHSSTVLSGRDLNATVPNVDHSGRMAHLSTKETGGRVDECISVASVVLILTGGSLAAATDMKLPETKKQPTVARMRKRGM